MKLIIRGNPVSKKNHSQIIMIGGRPRLIPSKPYREYEKAFIPQVPASARQRITTPHTVCCIYYMETRRRVDLGNLLNATCDLLVKSEVLQDDNSFIVASHDGSRVFYDKDNPRVEIDITPIARSVEV